MESIEIMNKSLEWKSTFLERYVDAIKIFLGETPPLEYIIEWVGNTPVDGIYRLQVWVLNCKRFPSWGQGIEFLDAMTEMCNNPREDGYHD